MAFKLFKNIMGNLRQLADRDVWEMADPGVPVDGTSGTGAGFAGIGSMYTDTTAGNKYINTGTKASPVWSILGASGFEPAFATVAAGTNTSGATTAVSIAVLGALPTDHAHVSWRNAPQTITPVIAVATTDAISVSFATTVGTAGTLTYSVLRAT